MFGSLPRPSASCWLLPHGLEGVVDLTLAPVQNGSLIELAQDRKENNDRWGNVVQRTEGAIQQASALDYTNTNLTQQFDEVTKPWLQHHSTSKVPLWIEDRTNKVLGRYQVGPPASGTASAGSLQISATTSTVEAALQTKKGRESGSGH